MFPLLAADGLGLQRRRRWILRDTCIQVRPGMVTAIVGPNGSGKSTLLRCLAGLWTPTEGRVCFEGKALGSLGRSVVAQSVSYLPQDTRLDFEFSVRDLVRMGRHPHRGRFDRETGEDKKAVEDALVRTDVLQLAARPVTELSGGERQRVLIARSLATRASVLLLDEPTSNLDVDHGLDILELCRSLAAEDRAIVIATHDLNAVCRFIDQVALIESGRVVAYGTPSDVLTRDNLEHTFGVRFERLSGSDGTPVLLFYRGRRRSVDSGNRVVQLEGF